MLADFGMKVTESDRATAATINSLYKSKSTPQLIKGLILETYFDLTKHYSIARQSDCARHWLSTWPYLLAVLRRQEHAPTKIRWTWQPDVDEEAELDAEQEREDKARAVFDLIQNPHISEGLKDAVSDILDKAHPWHTWEIFRTAWPLALEILAEEGDEDEAVAADIINMARAKSPQLPATTRESQPPAASPAVESPAEQPKQYTPILMEPITRGEYAAELAQQAIVFSGTDAMIELLAGIAATESPMIRQEIAQQAILAGYRLTDNSTVNLCNYVANIYAKGKDGEK
jgi:hypothetical protein